MDGGACPAPRYIEFLQTISSFRGSSQHRDWTHVSCLADGFFTIEPPGKPVYISSVQSLSHVGLFATPWTAACQASLVHHRILEFTQIHVHWVSDAIQPSNPLSSPSPPVFNFSEHQGLFQWVSSSHQVAKVLEFGFSISPSNEYSGLISLRMDWLDLLAVHRTPKSLL